MHKNNAQLLFKSKFSEYNVELGMISPYCDYRSLSTVYVRRHNNSVSPHGNSANPEVYMRQFLPVDRTARLLLLLRHAKQTNFTKIHLDSVLRELLIVVEGTRGRDARVYSKTSERYKSLVKNQENNENYMFTKCIQW